MTTTSKTYAGIGSRKTPAVMQQFMAFIATVLEAAGYTLRSGNAEGADQAFASATRAKEIYLPWHGFNNAEDDGVSFDLSRAHATVDMFHPLPESLTEGIRKLHARSAAVLAGPSVTKDDKVDFVIFWATGDKYDESGVRHDCFGGTGQAIRMAYHLGIPTYNVGVPEDRAAITVLLRKAFNLPSMDIKVADTSNGDAPIEPVKDFKF